MLICKKNIHIFSNFKITTKCFVLGQLLSYKIQNSYYQIIWKECIPQKRYSTENKYYSL